MLDQKAEFIYEIIKEKRRKLQGMLRLILGKEQKINEEEVFNHVVLIIIEKKNDVYKSKNPYLEIIRKLENRAKYILRKKNKNISIEDYDEFDWFINQSIQIFKVDDPHEILELNEFTQNIMKCAEKLRIQSKEIFYQGFIIGYSYEELSEMFGESILNIRVKIFRAKKSIIECLKEIYGTDIFTS